ncbi:MAG: phenylacetate--CoA ligase family protein [Polyangiaceae bacterium]|nr:phenylacetate--CoA ligase family protein [Polyangiaceae bacterium]
MITELVCGGAGAQALANVLEVTERWRPGDLEREQLGRLAALVEHARATVEHYSTLPAPEAGSVDVSWLRALPKLRRESVRASPSRLMSRAAPPGHRVVREAHTSGSSGKHVSVQVDAVTATMGEALLLRDVAWHQRDVTAKAAGIRAVDGAAAPRGRREPRWAPTPESGPALLLDVHTPVREQLAWLARETPAYLATYASNAAALIDECERTGTRLSGLRQLSTFGETFEPDLRQRCRSVLGVPLVDAYSSAELGYLALQCPEHTHYHVQSEHVLLEVLRDDGSACGIGESGRVVVTALHAFAMPLIRYELEDFATLGEACPCGRGLPVIASIQGRVRHMLRLPNGDRLWPRFGSPLIGRQFPLRQFRMVQTGVTTLDLEMVLDRPLTPAEQRQLRELVLGVVRFPMSLSLVPVDAISRPPGGKYEDFVSALG